MQILCPRFVMNRLSPSYGWPWGQCVFARYGFGFRTFTRRASLRLSLIQTLQARCPRLFTRKFFPSYGCPFGQCVRFSCQLRRLIFMSRILSAWVPKKRWCGLTHKGLSHLWQTSFSAGSSANHKSHATRWAFHFWNDININSPYAPGVLAPAPLHIQHTSGGPISTFDQKRFMSILYKKVSGFING